jgi:RNA polymerase sigma-70 factor (ECF subfamily)
MRPGADTGMLIGSIRTGIRSPRFARLCVTTRFWGRSRPQEAPFHEPNRAAGLLLSYRIMLAAKRPSPRLVLLARRGDGHPEDRELVDALVAEEPWAATAVWNKHSPMVFRFLQRALGPVSDVEDLTQEVFVVVFSRARELRNREALRSFIFSIAVRMLKWELRRRRVRKIFQLTSMGDLPDHPVPALDAESRQALRRFYAILDRLGAEDRSAFALRHLEGFKLEEVAGALGTSLATAKRRLQRATAIVSRYVDADPALAPYARGSKRGDDE